jgi:signal transduction histidine kinase
MGLAIAFTVIEQHGGLIEVESEPGEGATFMVYLPSSTL